MSRVCRTTVYRSRKGLRVFAGCGLSRIFKALGDRPHTQPLRLVLEEAGRLLRSYVLRRVFDGPGHSRLHQFYGA